MRYHDTGLNSCYPDGFVLDQNYPNPFNSLTKIDWRSPVTGWKTLKVYDVLGREIATLVNEERSAGIYEMKFDGSNLPSGIYIYRLTSGNYSVAKVLLK